MSDDFKCKYELDDGYVGGSRPQSFNISPHDIEDDMSDAQLETFFYEMAEDHRNQSISVCPMNMDEFKEWARNIIAKREHE